MNMREFGKLLAGATFLVSGLAFGGEYVYDATNPLAQYGEEIAMTYDGDGKITAMTVTMQGEDLLLTGDPLDFAEGARITLNQAYQTKFTIRNAIVAATPLTIEAVSEDLAWSGTLSQNAKGPVAAFDLPVECWELTSANMGEQGMAEPRAVTEGAGERTIWVTTSNVDSSSSWIKAVKLRFVTDENWQTQVYFVETGYTKRQTPYPDFDRLTRITSGTPTETDFRVNNYPISGLTAKSLVSTPIRLEGAVSGDFMTESDLILEVAEAALMNWATTLTGDAGKVIFDGGELSEATKVAEITAESTPKSAWQVFAVNQFLSEMTIDPSATKMSGTSIISGGRLVNAWTGDWVNDGQTASCWVQYAENYSEVAKPGTLKGVKVEFRQNGANVEIRTQTARYITQPAEPPYYLYGTDLVNTPGAGGSSIASSPTSSGYCLAGFKANFARAVPTQQVEMQNQLSDTTPIYRGTFVARGNVVLVSNNYFGEPRGGYELEAGTRLVNTSEGAYFKRLVLWDGARVYSTRYIRTSGGSADCYVKTRGTEPCYIQATYRYVGAPGLGDVVYPVIFDCEAPLVIDKIDEYPSVVRGKTVLVKSGNAPLWIKENENWGVISEFGFELQTANWRNQLRFGTSAAALTSETLDLIRWVKKPELKPELDAQGNLIIPVPGLVILVK